jgi:hypothetical protein
MKSINTGDLRCYIESDRRLICLIFGCKPQCLSHDVANIVSLTHHLNTREEAYTLGFEKTNGGIENVRLIMSANMQERVS